MFLSADPAPKTYPVFDVSFCGIAFCSPHYIWPGTRATVKIIDATSNDEHEVQGIVRRAARCGSQNCYRIGVEITRDCGNKHDWFSKLAQSYEARMSSCPLSCRSVTDSCVEKIELLNKR